MAAFALNNDYVKRLTPKLINGAIWSLVGWLGGSAVECARKGQQIGIECILTSGAESIGATLGEAWLKYTPFGWIVTWSGVTTHDYKSVIGTVPGLGCDPETQEQHESSCFNKSDIPPGYHFDYDNATVGWYKTNCRPDQHDDGLGGCWEYNKPRPCGVHSTFTHEKDCEKKYGKGNCEKSDSWYYQKCSLDYGVDYHSFGPCWCKSKNGYTPYQWAKVKRHNEKSNCKAGEEKHAGLCYLPPGPEWTYSSPGIYKRLKQNPLDKVDKLPTITAVGGFIFGFMKG